MRVLIDTNIILDFLQERKPFVEDAVNLFEKLMQEKSKALFQQLQSPIFIILFGKQQE